MRFITSASLAAFALWTAAVVALAQQPAAPRPGQGVAPPPPPPPAVKVGEAAPDFMLPYFDPPAEPGGRPASKQFKLSDFKGKKAVVVAWFPAAFSPG